MSFWLRELGGWLLVGLGLAVFGQVYLFCEAHWYFGATLLLVMGIFIFRGGIGLLKVAVAANVVRREREAPPVVRPAPTTRTWSTKAQGNERQASPVS
jgi:hypothetical protein